MPWTVAGIVVAALPPQLDRQTAAAAEAPSRAAKMRDLLS
jgi:hypothetical protein